MPSQLASVLLYDDNYDEFSCFLSYNWRQIHFNSNIPSLKIKCFIVCYSLGLDSEYRILNVNVLWDRHLVNPKNSDRLKYKDTVTWQRWFLFYNVTSYTYLEKG